MLLGWLVLIGKKLSYSLTLEQGSIHIEPVIHKFGPEYNIKFLHFDSLWNQDRPDKSLNENWLIEIFDLRYFDMSFFNALVHIKPDCMVFISLHGFIQRWANYIGSHFQISSCFICMELDLILIQKI